VKKFADKLTTERLLLRPICRGDARKINDAIVESMAQLSPWMIWAKECPTVGDTLAFCEFAEKQIAQGTDYPLVICDPEDTTIYGATGFNTINWAVPSFEFGYWCRTSAQGQGFVTEASRELTRYAFEELAALRVYLRIDDRNLASVRVAQRLGFQKEALIHNDTRANDGTLRDTCIYTMFSLTNLL
jgi:RimJ/RimL family protein N-acetyltransferase